MGDLSGPGSFTAYAAARWDVLVRTTVLLGVRPSSAPHLAARAIVSVERELARGGAVLDPDVELFAELLRLHRHDRSSWWRTPPTPDDADADLVLAPVERRLDRLAPDPRARLVLAAVAQLPEEQLDQVVTGQEAVPGDLSERVAAAARAVPVAPYEPALVRAARTRADERPPSRVVSWVAVSAIVALVVAGAFAAAAQVGRGLPIAEVPAASTSDGVLPGPGRGTVAVAFPVEGVPVPWYAGGVLHLGTVDVPLASAVALARIPGGVVVRTDDDRLLEVDRRGEVTRLARLAPGSPVAASLAGGIVAYIDDRLPREVTVFEVARSLTLARVPVDQTASVVAVDDLTVFVNDAAGHFATLAGGASRRTSGVSVLDAAAGVLAVDDGERVRLLRDGAELFATDGAGVELSPDGRYAVVRSAGESVAFEVVDVEQGRVVPLDLTEDGEVVTDITFDEGDSVVAVVRGPNSPPSRVRDDPDLTPRRSVFVSCSLTGVVECSRVLRLGGASTGPVLAH